MIDYESRELNRLRDINIDPEFESKIPALSQDEYNQLEDSIRKSGEINDKLITWNGVLVDGHNRRRILLDPKNRNWTPAVIYDTRELRNKETREEVIIWMIDYQIGRRNLAAVDRVQLILKKKDALATIAKQRQVRKPVNSVPPILAPQISNKETREILAKEAGVSHGTLDKYERLLPEMTEEDKQLLRDKKTTISAICDKKLLEQKYENGEVQESEINRVRNGDISASVVLRSIGKAKKKNAKEPTEGSAARDVPAPIRNPYFSLSTNFQLVEFAKGQIDRIQAFDDDYQEALDKLCAYIESVRDKKRK